MSQGILITDGSSRYLKKHVYPTVNRSWSPKKGFAPSGVLGKLLRGDFNSKTIEGFRGAGFSAFFSDNLTTVKDRVRSEGGSVIGGFCFLHHGEVCAVGTTNGRTVKWDLEQVPPKPIFDGGPEIPKSIMDGLGITALPSEWHLEVSGLKTSVSWDVLVKATHYFETARALGAELTLIVPSNEYAASSAANASLLNMDSEEVRSSLLLLGEKYASFLAKVGEAFFQDVKLKIVLTHDSVFRAGLQNFMERHKTISETRSTSGDGFISGADEKQVRAIRTLWQAESDSYLALFSSIFSSDKATIFMLHGRDFEGYPLEGLEAANNQFGPERIRQNVAFVGVPNAPIITIKQNAYPIIMRGLYGADSQKLTDREKPIPPHVDARFDAYFGLPGELLTSSGPLEGNFTSGDGNCPNFIYVRNLLPYTDGVSQAEAKGALRECNSDKSHDGCKAVFQQVHKEIKARLGE